MKRKREVWLSLSVMLPWIALLLVVGLAVFPEIIHNQFVSLHVESQGSSYWSAALQPSLWWSYLTSGTGLITSAAIVVGDILAILIALLSLLLFRRSTQTGRNS